MPKVKPLTARERKSRALMGAIAMGMIAEGKSNSDMAAALGMSASTWCRRRKDPGTMTLAELWRIQSLLPGTEITA